MSDFLSNNNVIANAATFNESLLRRVNVVRQVWLKPICSAFGNDFVDNVAKTNRTVISRDKRNQFLGNKSNVCFTNMIRKLCSNEKGFNQINHIISNPGPSGKIKFNIEPIWTRRSIYFHII